MKSNVVPLLGIIEAPGVKVNLGANAVISVPAFTINVTLLFSIIGSRLSIYRQNKRIPILFFIAEPVRYQYDGPITVSIQ